MLWLSVVTAGKTVWSSEELERQTFVKLLYEQEAVSLVRLARLFTDDRTGAEDIVQEAFIRFYHAAGRISERNKSASYLRSIVINLARDHNRRGLLSLRHQDSARDYRSVAPVEEDYVRKESQGAVLEALLRLSPRQRECIVLRFYAELSETEIAKELGISPNSVKTHCQRGMAALASELETVA